MRRYIHGEIDGEKVVYELIRRPGFPEKLYRRLTDEELGGPKLVAQALEDAYKNGRDDRLAEIKKALEI